MVQIGTVKSKGKAENYNFEFDDRQELVKTIGGAVVVDAWNGSRVSHTDGDVVQFTALFSSADASTIKNWWATRTKQNVTLDDGTAISNARILVRGIEMVDLFETRFVKLRLEVWRV